MNLSTMRTEVMSRGFSHVPTGLIDRWINDAYQDVNDRYPWGFLETSASGASPLTVADLGHILSVSDSTNKSPLSFLDRRDIIDHDPTLIATGSPMGYYLSTPTTISVYPTSSVNLAVQYVKVPTDLTADGDTPLSPTRFHNIYVEIACARCYRRANELEAAADCFNLAEQEISRMCAALLAPNYDDARVISGERGDSGSTDW